MKVKKWQKNLLLVPVFLLVVATVLEAAPTRRSRRGRTARRQTYSYSYSNYRTNRSTVTRTPTYTTPTPTTYYSPASYSPATQSPAAIQPQTYTLAQANPTTATTTPAAVSATSVPVASSSTAAVGGAMAEVNALRAQRGLPALIEDPQLSAVAHHKASIQANAGRMYHPGGSMGGARYEGVGMGAQFISCYLYSNVGQHAGAATVVGRNGQRFHCLLIR